MDIPLLANFFQLTETNWGHKTMKQNSACLGMNNRRCNFPRGKVMGGSSTINYMIYMRGNKKDFNNWSDLGNYGWSYDEVLPYFLKLEDTQVPEYRNSPIRGRNGPVTVTYPPYHTPLADSFLEAGKVFGYDEVDYNGETQTGFQYIQTTIRNGTRLSSNRAYIMPIRNRKNLHVKKFAQVTKVLINPVTKEAYGVEFVRDGRKYSVKAKKEVILSAGAFGSPQILMLSGVGPADHLKQLNIPLIHDLKVGYNLQDHLALGGLTFLIDSKISLRNQRIVEDTKSIIEFLAYHRGALSVPGAVEAVGFVSSTHNNHTDYPDIELLFIGGSVMSDPTVHNCLGITEDLYQKVFKPVEHLDAFSIFPMILRPKSAGRVLLKSNNPMKLPMIQHNYLTVEEDLDIVLQATRAAIAIALSEPFKKYGTRLHSIPIPACARFPFNSDDYWRCAIRQFTFTIYHQSGTCKMGPDSDPDAVVDPELRVRGIKNLRVIDASIMPAVTSGHTNAPVFMIAEKGADMIKKTWKNRA
jgi:choline dehydrogenase-like flavoprotein